MVSTLPARIAKLLESRGFRTGKEHYIQTLAQGLALFAMKFSPPSSTQAFFASSRQQKYTD